MAFTPDPNLFNRSFGGGLQNAKSLLGMIEERQKKSKLQEIGELAKLGEFNNAGSELVKLGMVAPGLNTLNIPYSREQDTLNRDFKQDQFEATQSNRLAQLAQGDRRLNQSAFQSNRAYELAKKKFEADQLPSTSLFDGKGLEGQALNKLVEAGKITRDEALELAAGKTVINPVTGAVSYLTPSGIVSKQRQQDPDNNQAITSLTDPKAANQNQNLAAGFADRMSATLPIIEQFEKVGTEYGQDYKSKVPLIGNSLVSSEYQQLDQAKRDFINAQLRRESGAAIAASEFENAERQYFPQPGDDAAVLAQKKAARQRAVESMGRDAGPTYSPKKQDGWTVRVKK